MAKRDVELIIRAKNAASRELDAVTKSLERLDDQQTAVGESARKTDSLIGQLADEFSKLQTVSGNLKSLDKIREQVERSGQALQRQKTDLQTARANLQEFTTAQQTAAASSNRLQKELAESSAALKQEAQAVAQTRQQFKQYEQDARRAAAAAAAAEKALAAARQRYATKPSISNEANLVESSLAVQRARQAQREAELAVAGMTQALSRQNQQLGANQKANAELAATLKTTQQAESGLAREIARTDAAISAQGSEIAEAEKHYAELAQVVERAEATFRQAAQANGVVGQSAAQVGQQLTILKAKMLELQAAQRSMGAGVRPLIDAQSIRDGDVALREATTTIRAATNAAARGEVSLRELGNAVEQTARSAQQLDKLEAAISKQGQAVTSTLADWKAAEAEVKRLAQALRATARPSEELAAAFGKAQGQAKAAKAAFQAEEAAAESLSASLRAAGISHQNLNEAQATLQARIASVRQSLLTGRAALIGYGEAGGGAARGSQNAANGLRQIPGAANQASSSLKDLIRQLSGVEQQGRQSLSLFQRFRGQLLSIAAASGGVYAVQSALQGVVQAQLSLDAVQSRFSVAFEGDQSKVQRAMDFTRQTADELGLVYTTLATQYSKLAAASLGTNLEGEKTEQIFRSISEAARVLRLTDDEVAGSFKALTDIISKGTIQAEELKGQLGDRFPGAVQIMAKALGVGTEELASMMEQGQLTSDSLVEFAAEIKKRVAPALGEAIESPAAAFDRLRNAIFDAQTTIAQSGFLTELANGAEDLAKALSDPAIQESLRAIGKGLGDLIRLGADVIPYIEEIGTALQVLAAFMVARFVGGALADTVKGFQKLRLAATFVKAELPQLLTAFANLSTAATAAGGGVKGLAAALAGSGLVRAGLWGVIAGEIYLIADAAYEAYQAQQQLENFRTQSAAQGAAAQDELREKTEAFVRAQEEAQGSLVKTGEQAKTTAERMAELADRSAKAYQDATNAQGGWIKSGDKVLKMTDKEIDAYQEYLIALMKVTGQRRTYAMTQPHTEENAQLIANLTLQENELARAVEFSATVERGRAEAVKKTAGSVKEMATAIEDAEGAADALDRRLNAVATMNFENSIIALERVHNAKMAALTVSGADENKILAQTTSFEQKRLDLVRQYSQKQLALVQQDTDKRKQILAGQEMDALKRAQAITKIEQEAADRRIQIVQNEAQQVQSAREAALNRYMAALGRVADLDRRIADLRLQGEFQVQDIRRSAMTEYQAYLSRQAELTKLNGRIQEEVAKGNLEVAESLAQRQLALAQQLNTEIKDGERVIVSKEQAAQNAVSGTEKANANLITVLEKRRAIEKAEAEEQKALYENLTTTLEKLNTTLAKMAGATEVDIPLSVDEQKAQDELKATMEKMRAVAFQQKVGVPITADTRDYLQKFDSEVLSADGSKIRVGVFLEDGAYKLKVNEIKNEEIVATARVEFSGTDLEKAINRAKEIIAGDVPEMQLAFNSQAVYDEFQKFSSEVQAKLSEESFVVTTQLQGNDEELQAKMAEIAATVTPSEVNFVPNTAAADQARNAIAQPIIVPVQYVPTNSVPQRSNGGVIRVPGFANGGSPGGMISGPGTTKSDSILAAVSNKEYIVRAMAVKKYGQGFMNALNSGAISADRLKGVMGGGSQYEATLNLTINGQGIGALSGSQQTVNNLVDALSELQRQLGNS
jgi:tape measure domain-containing protein